MFRHNYTGTQERRGGFLPMPEGEYVLTLTDTKTSKTKNGDPMVNVTFEVTGGEYDGRKVWHNVCFLPKENKGAGISKHFLKAIGQPFEGEVDVEPNDWRGAAIKAHLIITQYNGKDKNEIGEIIVEENTGEVPF